MRRTYRIVIVVIIVLLRFLLVNGTLMQSADIQSYLTRKTVDFLSQRYDLDVSIGTMDVKLPNRLVLKDICIEGQEQDTILSADEVTGRISAIKLRKKRLYLKEISIVHPNINVQKDSTGTFNFQFILDKFTSDKDKKEKTGEPFDVFCDEINLVQADVKYQDAPWETSPGVFNSSDVLINGFNIAVRDFQMHGDTTELELDNLAFQEKSGVGLKKMSGVILLSDSLYQISDLFLKSNHSMLYASLMEVALSGEGFKDPWNNLKLDIQLDSSLLSAEDAVCFMPDLKGLDQQVRLSADLIGTLSNLKINDFNFAYGKNTRLETDLRLNGLPDMANCFVFAEVHQLSTSIRDVETIYFPPFNKQQTFEAPPALKKVGAVNFEGTLVGMFNDLVANGLFMTNAGNIATDIAVQTNQTTGKIAISGDVDVMNVQIGTLLDKEELLGAIDMEANLNGSIDSTGRYNFAIGSQIHKAEVNNYPYSNINIAGRVTNTSFNGELSIDDPNLSFEFLGGYEMENNVPVMDFRADLSADLYELHFDTIHSEAGFLMIANLKGDGINTTSGNLQFANMYFKRDQDSVKIDKIDINTGNLLGEQFVDVKSDYFNIEVEGQYDVPDMITSLSGLVYHYLPVLAKKDKDWLAGNPGHLSFKADFYGLSDFTKFFMPQLRLDDSIKLNGNINANTDKYEINCLADEIRFDTITIKDFQMELLAGKESVGLDLVFSEIQNKENIFLQGFDLSTVTMNDSVQLMMGFDNQDSVQYAGDLKTTLLLKESLNDNIALNVHFYPSDFVLRNQDWKLNECRINIDSTEITVDNFKLYNDKQKIRFIGDVSSNPDKDLRYYIENVDIAVINPLLESSGYQLKGELNSNGRLADVYDKLDFRAFLELEDLYINKEEFGRIQVNSNYDHLSNAINLDGISRYISFRGMLNPTTDTINLTLNINNFGLSVLKPYLVDAGLLNVRGKLDGSIKLLGKLSDPDVRGALDFDRAGLTYDLLMARFNLSDSIFVYKDSLVFKNFLIADENGNPGVLKGKFTHENFKNIMYDFDINLDNYHIMNTTETDNSAYYGSAFATAQANIHGGTEDIVIDISEAETEKNTVFVLPMTNSYEADDNPYITFITDSVSQEDIKDLVPKSSFDVTFLLNIDVTPEAEARLVFDPKVGDMIRANCEGNLDIKVSPDADFSMKGELEVKGGDYLFTLQNVINKRFVLQEGGVISWDGDPMEGKLDLEAVYKLKAPLYDLMVGVDTSDIYKKRTEINCVLAMSGMLNNPDIRFDIEVPNADEKAKTRLASLTGDEINKQVLTLLVLNRFYTPDDMQMASSDSRGANIAGVTSFEMLSNQISNWLSQISDDFDVGVNYSPGDQITSQELEVALSTQLLNDRVLINGNVGVGEHENTTSDIVGDVEVQVKVNKSGNLRVKGFTRANTQSQMQYDYGPYTQGVGLFYTESFSTFGSLLNRYLKSITLDKEEKEEHGNTN
ncbi:MAG: translocation/assembly module TamB domain-containing protein [Bacteroidota bacterium]|nr:translocation/assembly module TamB domain-containing protein [Bacteroidota bacterium]